VPVAPRRWRPGSRFSKAGGNAADAAAATILALSVTDSGGVLLRGRSAHHRLLTRRRRVVEVARGAGGPRRGLATARVFSRPAAGIPGKGLEPAAVPAAFDGLHHPARSFLARCAWPDVAVPRACACSDPRESRMASAARAVDPPPRSRRSHRRGAIAVAGLRAGGRLFLSRGRRPASSRFWCEQNGGLIRYSDLATHTTRIEEPLSIEYRGHTVYKCGVWTQGPYLLQTLRPARRLRSQGNQATTAPRQSTSRSKP